MSTFLTLLKLKASIFLTPVALVLALPALAKSLRVKSIKLISPFWMTIKSKLATLFFA
jgi:hypothetical protein